LLLSTLSLKVDFRVLMTPTNQFDALSMPEAPKGA
jgi:hypothetical protein